MYVDKGDWSLAQIAAFGRGESGVRAAGAPTARPEPEPAEPAEPADTAEDRRRAYEEEVAEAQRLALLRARGFR